jgi:CheY-like chemotaxis protein
MGEVDGITLTRAVRSEPRTRHVPVVVITTSLSLADHTAAVEAGCDACIVLPASPEEIFEAVGKAVRTKTLGRVKARPARGRLGRAASKWTRAPRS